MAFPVSSSLSAEMLAGHGAWNKACNVVSFPGPTWLSHQSAQRKNLGTRLMHDKGNQRREDLMLDLTEAEQFLNPSKTQVKLTFSVLREVFLAGIYMSDFFSPSWLVLDLPLCQ